MTPRILPTDIILMVIESLLETESRDIYSPSSPVTKTLLAFAVVCRATTATATKLLWRHCMYIDSSKQARQLLCHLHSLWPPTIFQRGSVHLFLSPFDDLVEDLPSTEEEPDVRRNIALKFKEHESDVSSLGSSTSSEWPRSPLNDLPTALVVQDIFKLLAPVLTSLIIDMPLRSLYPESDDNGVRKVLRHGFELLVNLEEFVSVRDELFLATEVDSEEPEVWSTYWPEIRRVALYNASLYEDDAWKDLAQPPHLDMAVLTRPDPGRWITNLNLKKIWFDLDMLTRSKPFAMVLVDCAPELPDFSRYVDDWNMRDPHNRLQISTLGVSLHEDETGEQVHKETFDMIEACQEWVKEQSLRGELWNKAKETLQST